MTIRYFNIKEKPDVNGFAIKVDTNKYMKKNVESFSSENHLFEKIREDEKYAHFKLIEEDYSILRDKTADATTIGANPRILKKGKGNIANVCLDESGNIKVYNKKNKLLVKEISSSKAYSLRRDARNWRGLQAWV
jgi:hypothetical protein